MKYLAKDQRTTIGELSIDAKKVYDALILVPEGSVIEYSYLSNILQRDIQKKRGILATARRMAQRELGLIFDCISNVGLKRLNSSQIAEKVTTQPFRRIKSTVRSTVGQMHCIKHEELTNDEHVRVIASRSILEMIADSAKQGNINDMARHTAEPLPVGKTLKFLMTGQL